MVRQYLLGVQAGLQASTTSPRLPNEYYTLSGGFGIPFEHTKHFRLQEYFGLGRVAVMKHPSLQILKDPGKP